MVTDRDLVLDVFKRHPYYPFSMSGLRGMTKSTVRIPAASVRRIIQELRKRGYKINASYIGYYYDP